MLWKRIKIFKEILNEWDLEFIEKKSLWQLTLENIEKDLTEYYNLMYQYKNDCLAASIEYNKEETRPSF